MKRSLALLLAALLSLTSLEGCSARKPEGTSALQETTTPYVQPQKPLAENTLENRVKALQETALAFYYQNPSVQYDNRTILSATGAHRGSRTTSDLTPEAAGLDNPLFSVCSDYTHKVVKQALGYDMLGVPNGRFVTAKMTQVETDDPLSVFQFDDGDTPKDHTGLRETLQGILKPGDIFVYFNANSKAGHAVLYTGDIFGDGEDTRLELWGKGLDLETGEDPREADGGVRRGDMLKNTLTDRILAVNTRMAILRPAEMPEAKLTDYAQVRLRYPHMEMHKTFSQSTYFSVQSGDTVTVSLTVANHSGEDYTDLYLSDPVPQGQTVTRADGGGQLQKGEMVWLLTVPKGETVTVSYDVSLQGNVGDYVQFPAGAIDGMLPTRAAEFRFGVTPMTDAQKAKFAEQRDALIALAESSVSATDFANKAYASLFGADLGLPEDGETLLLSLTETVSEDGVAGLAPLLPQSEELRKIEQMIIPKCFSGNLVYPYTAHNPATRTHFDMSNRILAYWREYFQPGDFFLVYDIDNFSAYNEEISLQLLLDDFHVLVYHYYRGKPVVEIRLFYDTVQSNLLHGCVIGFRPSQALTLSE